MKKLYSALFILFTAGSLNAQPYMPMLDSSNTWSYAAHAIGVRLAAPSSAAQAMPCTYPTSSGVNSFKQYTTADTVINSMTYKIVENDLYACTMGYIREDVAARKVYFIDNVSLTEKVLYDFSMTVGDTMSIQFMGWGAYVSGVYTLDSITTVNVFAGPRRAFHYNNHLSPGSYTFTAIESVGNLSDLLYPYFDNSYGFGLYSNYCPGVQYQLMQFMICFDHTNKVYFDNCAYTVTQNNPSYTSFTDSCDYTSFIGAINDISISSGFDIYPNPSNGKSTIAFEATCENDYDVYVWDMQGKMIVKQIPLGRLHAGNNTTAIDFSGLTNGTYLVEIRSADASLYSKVQVQ